MSWGKGNISHLVHQGQYLKAKKARQRCWKMAQQSTTNMNGIGLCWLHSGALNQSAAERRIHCKKCCPPAGLHIPVFQCQCFNCPPWMDCFPDISSWQSQEILWPHWAFCSLFWNMVAQQTMHMKRGSVNLDAFVPPIDPLTPAAAYNCQKHIAICSCL